MDAYKILGVSSNASLDAIKTAYRELVKKHHPDAGGDEKKIIDLNAAWEVLKDQESRLLYDQNNNDQASFLRESHRRGKRNAQASAAANATQGRSVAADNALSKWLQEIYIPIDRLLGQIINPFLGEVKALSADPYDDQLMGQFCAYVEESQNRLEKVKRIYQSLQVPISAQGFGLNLYHCLSQVEDAIDEFERYTMGYVDEYLHDGKEMLHEAKQRRLLLKEECRKLDL